MARGEVLYGERCAAVLTVGERQRELADLRMPLTQFEIEVESLGAAREAFLCVRDDGISMEEVAREGHYPFRRSTLLVEGIPLAYQQRFLGASPGDLLDPIERGDGFQLFRFLKKWSRIWRTRAYAAGRTSASSTDISRDSSPAISSFVC